MSKLGAHEKNSLLISIQKMYEWLEQQPTETPCTACHFYAHGICRQADNEKIPADILPKGCAEWKFDETSMPF
jgi:hypothetical protein